MLAHLAFLIVCAMLLTNVVMIKFAERDLIQAKLQTGRLLIHALGKMAGYEIIDSHRKWADLKSDHIFKRQITQLLQEGGFSDVLMLNKEGLKAFSSGSWGKAERNGLSISREALTTRKPSFRFYGSTWGVIWLAHKRVGMSAPMLCNGRLIGAVTIRSDLSPLYETLRKSEKIILIYIILNTIILILFGIYLISRTVVKPIHKLLRITEQFKEGEPFPQLEHSSRNEIGQLFRSLNMMLKRLDENKRELETHISSLEKANQEIKKAQEEIIKSEKLASIGRLATGVAHEIGNPIGIILGYLELLKGGDLSNEERGDFLGRTESEITRISQIIRQLLDFSRPASGEHRQTGVHELIIDTVNMLKPQSMMAEIEVGLSLEAANDIVWADPNQLKQVFLNVIMNAADAMRDCGPGKTLTIETAGKEGLVELRFTDTGLGIEEQELFHVFDPFYTTKEPGKGTGLGLSICYRIIEGLGGAIRAESPAGKGAIIIIDIPLRV